MVIFSFSAIENLSFKFPLVGFHRQGGFFLAVETLVEHFQHTLLVCLDRVVLDFLHRGEIQIEVTNEWEVIAYPLAVAEVQTFGYEQPADHIREVIEPLFCECFVVLHARYVVRNVCHFDYLLFLFGRWWGLFAPTVFGFTF